MTVFIDGEVPDAIAGSLSQSSARIIPSNLARRGIVFFGLIAYAAGVFVLWMGDIDRRWIYDSPQDNVRAVLAEQWVDTGRPTYPLPLYGALPADIAPALTPRDASLDVESGTVIPKDFANSVVLYSAVAAIDPSLLRFVCPVGAALALLSVGLLTWRMIGRFWPTLVAAALFASSSALWATIYNGSSVHGVTISLALLGLAILVPVVDGHQFIRSEDARYVVAGTLIGTSVGFHTGLVFAYVAALVVFFVGGAPRWGSITRRVLFFALGAGASMVPSFAFNWWLYGAPQANGYSRFDDLIQATNPQSGIRTFAVDLSALWINVRVYWLRPEIVVLLSAASMGVFALLRVRAIRLHPGVAVAVVTALAAHTLLTGARYLYGTDFYRANSSYNRYSLPLIAYSCVLAAVGMSWLWAHGRRRNKVSATTIFVAIVLLYALAIYDAPAGFRQGRTLIESQQVHRDAILEIVPLDALIITNRSDKYFWPQRTTLIASYLITDPSEAVDPTERYLIDQTPLPSRVAEVSSDVTARGYRIFFFGDAQWFTQLWAEWFDYSLYYERHGLCRQVSDVWGLYEIVSDCPVPPPPPVQPVAALRSE